MAAFRDNIIKSSSQAAGMYILSKILHDVLLCSNPVRNCRTAGRITIFPDSEAILQSAEDFGIGHLLCIEQPDSKGEPRKSGYFPMINSFEQILSTKKL